MAIIPTQQDYDMLQQSTRDLQIKIELLNFNLQTVDTIEGNVIDGNINIDANQDLRRTCNISLVVTDTSFAIEEGGKIWLDKYIRINMGYTDILTKTVKFWNMGIFMINNPTRTYNASTNTLSFEGLDLMAKLTGKRNGQLEALITLIPAGTPIKDAIISVITQLGGFTNYVIDNTDNVVPYDIKVEASSYVYDILTQLRDLYSSWEMFFDTDGVFNFKKIPDGVNNSVVLDLGQLNTQININDNLDVNFENVKNYIVVYGRLLDDGTQIKSQIGDYFANSPYNVSKMGKIRYIVTDEKIYTNELAAERAFYELYLHARMNDAINIEVVPVYWLNDVNVCIYIDKPGIGIQDKYLIKNISIPLGIDSNMTIGAIKVYPDEVIPKPVVTINPTSLTSSSGSQMILDAYVSGDYESFEINPSTDINWTFPIINQLSDFMNINRISKIGGNHIRLRYDVSVPAGSTYGYSANLTSQIKENVSLNVYGIGNNISNTANITVNAFPGAVHTNFGPIWSTHKLIGETTTIYVSVYDTNMGSVMPVDIISENSLIYDSNVIKINEITFTNGTYPTLKIVAENISTGLSEIYVKENIFIDSAGSYNDRSISPFYITSYSSQDLFVSINDLFIYHNVSADSFRISATTDADVDSFEITENDLEYDDYYFKFDYVSKVSNNQIFIYFNNVNANAINNETGLANIRIKGGVAMKNGIPSIPSNVGVAVEAYG